MQIWLFLPDIYIVNAKNKFYFLQIYFFLLNTNWFLLQKAYLCPFIDMLFCISVCFILNDCENFIIEIEAEEIWRRTISVMADFEFSCGRREKVYVCWAGAFFLSQFHVCYTLCWSLFPFLSSVRFWVKRMGFPHYWWL